MEKNDKKIDFDLDFLSKDATKANPNKEEYKKHNYSTDTPKDDSEPMSDTVKKWWVGAGVVALIIFIGVISDDSSTTTKSATSTDSANTLQYGEDDLVKTGEFWCSSYHHSKAGEIEPAEVEGSVIETKTNQLSLESDRLESELYQIENAYVDEYDQWSIDQHNAEVDSYNSRLESYNYKSQIHQRSIDTYNSKVQIYNNYLITNCTPAN